jgi:hypothetical protein
MARGPASYPTLVQPEPVRPEPQLEEQGADSELLRDVAQRLVLYISPEAHKALSRYALEQSGFRAKVKVHDIAIEALESWMQAHGLNVPVRAKERR